MTDPVLAGLLGGLRPYDSVAPANEIQRYDAAINAAPMGSNDQLALIRARDRARELRARERAVEIAEKQLAVQHRTAQAAERQADAMETLVALFASVTGVGQTQCSPDWSGEQWKFGPVNFIRTGDGNKSFKCEQNLVREDDGE